MRDDPSRLLEPTEYPIPLRRKHHYNERIAALHPCKAGERTSVWGGLLLGQLSVSLGLGRRGVIRKAVCGV